MCAINIIIVMLGSSIVNTLTHHTKTCTDCLTIMRLKLLEHPFCYTDLVS